MRGHRNAGDAIERGHDRRAAGADRGSKGRQIDFMQGAFGNIDRPVFAPRLSRAAAAEMLGGRGDRRRRGQICSLETANFRLGEFRADERIFARTLGDSSPARISRDVQHWRECQRDAVVRGLDRRRARRALPKAGSNAAASASGIGKIVLCPCNTSRPNKRGMASLVSSNAIF